MTPQKRILTTIGFDADDTLWENQCFYSACEEGLAKLLAGYCDIESLPEKLLECQKRNLQVYGFGIKGFTLSMIETAIEVTDGSVPTTVIREILALGHDMLYHPVEMLPHVQATLEKLRGSYRLVLITKGDLMDQERKLAESRLIRFFEAVEVVSDKTMETYARVFTRTGDGPGQSMMVGNSLKSDVVPAIQAGCWGVYVPHDLTWRLEHVDAPVHEPRFRRLAHVGELPALLKELEMG